MLVIRAQTRAVSIMELLRLRDRHRGAMPAMSSSPIHVVVEHVAGGVGAPAALTVDGHLGVVATMTGVPDPRARRGVRYAFTSILAVPVCATLAGARSFAAIGECAAELSARQRQVLAIFLHRLTGKTNIAAALRHTAADPDRAIPLTTAAITTSQ